ncbi:MAG TPA: NapC/NirT family cytochrome c [Terriglobales bacterium]|nr:NapC/NirT family cytochrome c [Terriglobales bacterium]
MSSNEPPAQQNSKNERMRGLFRNTISLIGTALAAISLANIAFLFLIDFTSSRPSPYIGIFAYVIMPAFLILGLLLIPVGMLLERRRRRKLAPGEIPAYPRLDLNNPAQRRSIAFFISFVVVFVMLTAIGSYRAYEFSDSVQFCGQLCHTVMKPEYVAYTLSPHARVACVDCHVGAGAGWYVKSKLSGAYQVYAAAFNKYPRPIPTPVENLRPAQGTCEQCHWPRKFHGEQFKVITHFAADEKNTPRQVRMLIKTGGGDPATGVASGIHWHMNIGNEVTYAVTDPKRQNIQWVQKKDLATGRTTVYQSKDMTVTPEEIQKAPKRVMDCIDCHNRPTHIYVPPDRSVDQSLIAKRLDPNMPFIKQQAVAALTGDYKSEEDAAKGITKSLTDFYSPKGVDKATLDKTIKEVQRIYDSSIFPYMKVDWRTHPDNIGHFYFPGCFRCHDGNHVSSDGKVISRDCTICHVILGQDEGPEAIPGRIATTGFTHPVDVGDVTQLNCYDCHTGGTQ